MFSERSAYTSGGGELQRAACSAEHRRILNSMKYEFYERIIYCYEVWSALFACLCVCVCACATLQSKKV